MIPSRRSSASGVIAFSVASKRFRMNGANFAGAIGPSSICFALRQKGSFLSLKIRSSTCRLLPR